MSLRATYTLHCDGETEQWGAQRAEHAAGCPLAVLTSVGTRGQQARREGTRMGWVRRVSERYDSTWLDLSPQCTAARTARARR